MASLANANLPSSDEEDDDYIPTLDPTGEKEPGQQQQKQGASRKRCVAAEQLYTVWGLLAPPMGASAAPSGTGVPGPSSATSACQHGGRASDQLAVQLPVVLVKQQLTHVASLLVVLLCQWLHCC
jgi:hypothetical protein